MSNMCLDVIRNRRSVRLYSPQQIKQEEVDVILEAALWAPSAHNSQPWHFTVIQNRELINNISEICKADMKNSPIDWVAKIGNGKRSIFYDAPTVVIVSGKKEDFLNPVVDCAAAIQNMLLAAESINIGSCWIGLIRYFFDHQDEVAKLEMPEGYEPFYAVCLGYKALHNGHGLKRKEGTINYIR